MYDILILFGLFCQFLPLVRTTGSYSWQEPYKASAPLVPVLQVKLMSMVTILPRPWTFSRTELSISCVKKVKNDAVSSKKCTDCVVLAHDQEP